MYLTRNRFSKFIEALIPDRVRVAEAEKEKPSSVWGPYAGDWQNASIEHFLESAVAWAADTNFGLDQGLSSSNPWKRFAVFLLAGKIYE